MEVSLPHVAPGDRLRVSASTYVAWKQCPDRANARLLGEYGPETLPAFLGNLAHRIFSRHLTTGPVRADRFDSACREEIGASLNRQMAGLGLKPSTLAPVIEEARRLYERFAKLTADGLEASEMVLLHKGEDGLELIGKVDAVFRGDAGGHRLVDWKTGELGASEDQLMFYALLWALEKGEPPVLVEAVSVRTGERRGAAPSAADLARVAEDVGRLANGVRWARVGGDRLPTRPGPWCRHCPILADCSEGGAVEALLAWGRRGPG